MKWTVLICVVLCNSVLAVASNGNTPVTDKVTAELSRRTGIPEAELFSYLSDCDASQQSMNLCAFRDFVAADLALQDQVSAKIAKYPNCKTVLENKTARFEKDRDAGCEQSASKEYGNASMKPLAQAQCATFETKKMNKAISKFHGCHSQ